jgi:hypothetical protein
MELNAAQSHKGDMTFFVSLPRNKAIKGYHLTMMCLYPHQRTNEQCGGKHCFAAFIGCDEGHLVFSNQNSNRKSRVAKREGVGNKNTIQYPQKEKRRAHNVATKVS